MVQERENGVIVTNAQLLQTAVNSTLSKPSRTQFQKMIKSLNVVTKCHAWLFGEDEEIENPEDGAGTHSKGLWD